jgi:predicted  nucleic acid-binding Zn-ribbon protein
MMMDDGAAGNAAAAWTLELTRAGNDISQAASKLQRAFQDASEKALTGNDPIPDPVKLLRRMAALESRIDQLKRDAVNVAHGRKDLALSITDIQLKNAHLLQKVCYHAECISIWEHTLADLAYLRSIL